MAGTINPDLIFGKLNFLVVVAAVNAALVVV
jgi:hypothetical protein